MTVIERPIAVKNERASELKESVELQAIGLVQAIVAQIEQEERLLDVNSAITVDDNEAVPVVIDAKQDSGPLMLVENNFLETEPNAIRDSTNITELSVPVAINEQIENTSKDVVKAAEPITVEIELNESFEYPTVKSDSHIASGDNLIGQVTTGELVSKINEPIQHAEVASEVTVSQIHDLKSEKTNNDVIEVSVISVGPVEVPTDVMMIETEIDETNPKQSVPAGNEIVVNASPLSESSHQIVDITSADIAIASDVTVRYPLSVDVSSADIPISTNQNIVLIPDQTSEMSDDLIMIATPQNDEYVCKVEPTEYDITVAEANQACPNSTSPTDEQALIGQILPNESIVDDTTIPQAILISSKPALVALDLANGMDLLSTNVPDNNLEDTLEIIDGFIQDTSTIDESKILLQQESIVVKNGEPIIECSQVGNDSNVSSYEEKMTLDMQSTVDVSSSIADPIDLVFDTTAKKTINAQSTVDVSSSIADPIGFVSDIISEEVASTPDAVAINQSEATIIIPVVIVTESSEQAIEYQPPKTITKQNSLEIPIIDIRDNFEDLMKPQMVLSTSVISNHENDSEFVFVSDAEVAALKFEVESTQTLPVTSPSSYFAPAEASTNAQVDDVDVLTVSTVTLSNTTNITDTKTIESTPVPITENTLVTPTVSHVDILKPEGLFIGTFNTLIAQKIRNICIL